MTGHSTEVRAAGPGPLDGDLLIRWFLDMNLDEPCFEHSTFSQNSEGCWPMPWSAVFRRGRSRRPAGGRLSDEHFTVDGALIDAWALLLKSVTSKKPSAPAAPLDDPGNPTVNFHSDRYTM